MTYEFSRETCCFIITSWWYAHYTKVHNKNAEKSGEAGDRINLTEADEILSIATLQWPSAFFGIIDLMLCAIAARAGKPIVIKDSEAIKYVGKKVQVRERVVSVTTSPTEASFINFGGNTLFRSSPGLSRPGQNLRHTRDSP